MATQDQGNSGVPQFLTKLWLLVEDSSTNHLIQWGEEGTTFLVLDQPQFAKEVLPQFFKHSNMASFVRQLNMYGFRKVANIEQGALKSVREDVEFVHPHFIRGQLGLLGLIKRKVSSKEEPKVKTEEVNKILSDVKGMKTKQEDINGTLDSMKRENQALWSEVMILRQRHDKQQKVVNRLIQFLLTLVNPVGVNKRKQQLAIEPGVGSSGGPSKQAKYGRQISLHAGNLEDLINLQTASNLDAPGTRLSDIIDNHNTTSGCGVTVSEVTSPLEPNARPLPDPSQTQAVLDGDVTPAVPVSVSSETVPAATSGLSDIMSLPVSDLVTPMTLSMIPELGDISTMPLSDILAPSTESEPIVTSPPPSVEQTLTTPVLNDDGLSLPASQGEISLIPKESGDSSQMSLLQHPHAGILQRALSTEEIEQKEQLGTDLNTLQANIESIQSLLSGNASLTVDPDVLLGVFSHGGGVDDSNLFDLSTDTYDFNPANFTGTSTGSGTEMIEYNPGLSPFAAAAGMGISAVDVSDDDSLLESLNEDSRLLAKNRVVQEEVD